MSLRIEAQRVFELSNAFFPKLLVNTTTREAVVHYEGNDIYDEEGRPLWGGEILAIEPREAVPEDFVGSVHFSYSGPEGHYLLHVPFHETP